MHFEDIFPLRASILQWPTKEILIKAKGHTDCVFNGMADVRTEKGCLFDSDADPGEVWLHTTSHKCLGVCVLK